MSNKDPSDIIIIIRRNQNGDLVYQSDNILPSAYANVLSNVNASGLSTPGTIAYSAMTAVE